MNGRRARLIRQTKRQEEQWSKVRYDDCARHHDPRAEGSTDPLGRFCSIHDRPYESMGSYSVCSRCLRDMEKAAAL